MKLRSTQEWLALFRELEIPAAPLNTPGELFDNEHLNAVACSRPWTPRTDRCASGRTHLVLCDARSRRGAGARARRHTAEILDELGLAVESDSLKVSTPKEFSTMAVPVYKRILDLFEAEA